MKISLAAARKNAGLTQTESSKLLGISKPTLVGYEKGRYEPRISVLVKMSEIYGCEIADFKEVSDK